MAYLDIWYPNCQPELDTRQLSKKSDAQNIKTFGVQNDPIIFAGFEWTGLGRLLTWFIWGSERLPSL